MNVSELSILSVEAGYEWNFNTCLASPLISFRIRPYWAMFERQKGATSLLELAFEAIIDVFFFTSLS